MPLFPTRPEEEGPRRGHDETTEVVRDFQRNLNRILGFLEYTIHDVVNDPRKSRVLDIIPRDTGLKLAFRTLANNQFVVMAGDQDARGNGVFVEFLGRPASAAKGPALFAIRRNAAIIPCFMHRVGPGKHFLETNPPMWPDRSLDEDASVFDLTQRYMHALADAVRRHPTEYLWGHRRWKHAQS